MGHFERLQFTARITYYIGWIALICGGLVHVNIAKALFANINLSQRNLFEVSVVCFLICAASELRVLSLNTNVPSSPAKKTIAA
jgi:hypothetical protein